MSSTRGTLSKKKPTSGPADDARDPAEPETRSSEEVAREIGASAAGGSSPSHLDDDALRDGGRLKLDKSGALAGRPKLRPVRAHRKDEASDGEDGSRGAGAPAATEDETPRESRKPGGRPRKAVLPPKIGALRPEGFAEAPPAPEPTKSDDIEVPAGTFLYGDAKKSREIPAFRIDRYPVTNAAYDEFVKATGHRHPLYWVGGRFPDVLSDHPVVGVDYFDALAFARWAGKDLPFEDEWERAARGTDGRVYPWGNDQELSGANTARVGLKMTVPVDLHPSNVSPDGVCDMVGNVWEMTHSPAPGGGVVVRGGSWYDFALYAKTFFRFASRADARNGTIGFRCVVRDDDERAEAPREIDLDQAEAEMAARRGEEPPVDVMAWSVEKRDLVPDLPRLKLHVEEARAEALLGAPPAPVPEPAPSISFPPPPPAPKPEPTLHTDTDTDTDTDAPASAEPASEAPVHVQDVRRKPDAPAPAVSSASEAVSPPPEAPRPDRLEVQRQAERVDAASRVERAAARMPSSRAMPVWMWGLLALGFLLFGGLLVTLVNQKDGDEPAQEEPEFIEEPTPSPRSRIADLPEQIRYEEFPGANEPPRVLDAAYASDLERIKEGVWLLVFLDPATSEGLESLSSAHQLHRRVAPAGVNVTVVLPRTPYEGPDGKLLEDDNLDAALKADGRRQLWDGIHVVLDPVRGDRGAMHAEHASASGAVSAVLLNDGVIESRTVPPEGGLRLETLVPVALKALELVR